MRPGLSAAGLVVAVALASCAGAPQPERIEVGRHRLHLVTPKGWERVDHGREQLFRNGETSLRLTDLGPATREGLLREIGAAESLWLAGRRLDALARMRTLHGPPVRLLPQEARAHFWAPWTNVTYVSDPRDSAALGRAFAGLKANAEALPATPAASLIEHVLMQSSDAARRELARRDSLGIHGARWVVLETWDRTSHLYRRRTAVLDDGGYLLTLSTEGGVFERQAGAFDSLLASIEVLKR